MLVWRRSEQLRARESDASMRGKSTKVAIEPPLSPASNEAPLSPMTLETAREVTHAMRQAGEAAPLFSDAFRAPASNPGWDEVTATLGGAGIGWRSGPAVEAATTLAESRVLATESVISVSPYSRGVDEYGFEVVSKGKDEVVRKYRVMAAGDQSREEWTKAVSGLVVSGSGADIATARAEQHKTAQKADEARVKSVEPARRGLKRGTASVRKAEAAARSWRFKTLLGCILAGFVIVFLSKGCGSLDCGEHGRCSGGLIAESCLCTDNHAVSNIIDRLL